MRDTPSVYYTVKVYEKAFIPNIANLQEEPIMKKTAKLMLSAILVVAMILSLSAVALAEKPAGFEYVPGVKAPSDVVITDGTDTVSLNKRIPWDYNKEEAAEYVALTLFENGQANYNPVVDEESVYTFTVDTEKLPAAFCFIQNPVIYKGGVLKMAVVAFGYEDDETVCIEIVKTATGKVIKELEVVLDENVAILELGASVTGQLGLGGYEVIVHQSGTDVNAEGVFSTTVDVSVVSKKNCDCGCEGECGDDCDCGCKDPKPVPPTPVRPSGDHKVVFADEFGNAIGVSYNHNGDVVISTGHFGSLVINEHRWFAKVIYVPVNEDAEDGITLGYHGEEVVLPWLNHVIESWPAPFFGW